MLGALYDCCINWLECINIFALVIIIKLTLIYKNLTVVICCRVLKRDLFGCLMTFICHRLRFSPSQPLSVSTFVSASYLDVTQIHASSSKLYLNDEIDIHVSLRNIKLNLVGQILTDNGLFFSKSIRNKTLLTGNYIEICFKI